MIVLSSSDKLTAQLSADVTTNQPQCYVSYCDEMPGRNEIKGSATTLTNGTTPVVLAGSPMPGFFREIKYLSVQNVDTAAAQVSIKFDANGTTYELTKVTLAAGEKLEYSSESGFKVLANSGAVKTSLNQGNNPVSSEMSRVLLANDVVNNNAIANTIADVTGLSFPVTSGKLYYFRFVIFYDAAATTTGSRWAINGPSASYLAGLSRYGLTATSETLNYFNAYNIPAAANATSVGTTGNIAIIEGYITPSAAGDVIARFASEVSASTITAKAGSYVEYIQLT